MHHLRSSIKYVQMLHYKTVNLDRILENKVLPRSDFEEGKNADILIAYAKDDDDNNNTTDDIVSTILRLRWDSDVDHQSGEEVVCVKSIDCVGFDSSETPRPTISASVEFRFASPEAATQFFHEVEAIRMDLFIIHLQYPREDERTVLKLQAQSVHTQQVHIRDADITILQNTTTHRFRLLIQSRNGYSILSQELKEDFFDTLVHKGQPDYDALAYEVHMDETGKRRVRRCPKGFHHLVFTDSKIDKVFSIGLRAVGRLPQLRLSEGPQPMEGVVPG